MELKEVDKWRLERVKQVLSAKKLRFPNAIVVEKTGETKGNVSNYLRGKKPMSDNFYRTFMKAFNKKLTGSDDDYDPNDLPMIVAEQREDFVNALMLQKENHKLKEEITKLNKDRDDLLIKIGALKNQIENLKNEGAQPEPMQKVK